MQLKKPQLKKRDYFIIAFFLFFIPAVSLAVSSTNYIIDPSGSGALHQNTSSTNYQLEGSLEPIVGRPSATNYISESGSSFAGYCGDGFIDPSESCEGVNLNSETCVTQGFASGTLTCKIDCTFDTSSCVTASGGGAERNFPPSSPTFDTSIQAMAFTYSSKFVFSGGRVAGATLYINGTDSGVDYLPDNRWQKIISLSLGSNSLSVVARNNFGDSSSISITIKRRRVGDVNDNGIVNDFDFSLLANNWNTNWAEANFNRDDDERKDNIVDDYDLSLMAAFWTK